MMENGNGREKKTLNIEFLTDIEKFQGGNDQSCQFSYFLTVFFNKS